MKQLDLLKVKHLFALKLKWIIRNKEYTDNEIEDLTKMMTDEFERI